MKVFHAKTKYKISISCNEARKREEIYGKKHEKKIKISVPRMTFKYRKATRITVGKFGMKHARKKSNVSRKKQL